MKLSIITPAMRTHYWPKFLETVRDSCQTIPYEIIFISPFDMPDSLKADNIIHLKSYAPVPVCIQKGTLLATGDIVCHAVDDSVFFTNTLDMAVNYFINYLSYKDALTLTYTENTNNMNIRDKWKIKNISEFNGFSWIDPEWITFVQPMMYRKRFLELGGFDCSFEYSNHPHHDLAFRMHLDNSNVDVAPFSVSYAYHMAYDTGDHGPIYLAQDGPDMKKFREKWTNISRPEIFIDYNNYKAYDKRWERRFKKEYNSYQEMYQDQYSSQRGGYNETHSNWS